MFHCVLWTSAVLALGVRLLVGYLPCTHSSDVSRAGSIRVSYHTEGAACTCKLSSVEKLIVAQLVKNFLVFMQIRIPLPCSQNPTTEFRC
jgi:hypothetical protein